MSVPGHSDLWIMEFQRTKLEGVFEIHIEPKWDERGLFARTWCAVESQSNNLNPKIVQCNTSFNPRKGTLRGLHYQDSPRQEAKLIRCTRGAICDVAVDLRPCSPTFKQWVVATLSAENRKMLYVPEGCGHGFLTLEDDTEVFYQMSEFYAPECSRGFRWNDPAFGIAWPDEVKVISERDRTYPDFH